MLMLKTKENNLSNFEVIRSKKLDKLYKLEFIALINIAIN